MSLLKQKQSLKAQIIDTERLLLMVIDHPLMAPGLKEKLISLKDELSKIPEETFEAKIQLLFSGDAVIGSQGVKSNFISRIMSPFQELVKSQFTLVKFGRVGKRGKTKDSESSDLYLTALPQGSFGIELTQLKTQELFDTIDIATALKQVVNIVASAATSDESFEKMVSDTPKRNLNNLKRFLEEIADNNSVLKMESNEIAVAIEEKEIKEAFSRVSEVHGIESDLVIRGVFRGILLDSGRFEVIDDEGNKISGFIHSDLTEDELIQYDHEFLNAESQITLKQTISTFKTGNVKTAYELVEIRPLNND